MVSLQVLMLDEPTSGLDSETAVAIMQLMQDLTRQVQYPHKQLSGRFLAALHMLSTLIGGCHILSLYLYGSNCLSSSSHDQSQANSPHLGPLIAALAIVRQPLPRCTAEQQFQLRAVSLGTS